MTRKALIVTAVLAMLGATGCDEEMVQTEPRQHPGSPFHYPEDLWDAGVEGETILRLFVSSEGAVDTVQVDQGSGYAAFDSAAVAGARELRFDPALRGDEPIGVWVLLPVQFDLPTSAADSAAVQP